MKRPTWIWIILIISALQMSMQGCNGLSLLHMGIYPETYLGMFKLIEKVQKLSYKLSSNSHNRIQQQVFNAQQSLLTKPLERGFLVANGTLSLLIALALLYGSYLLYFYKPKSLKVLKLTYLGGTALVLVNYLHNFIQFYDIMEIQVAEARPAFISKDLRNG